MIFINRSNLSVSKWYKFNALADIFSKHTPVSFIMLVSAIVVIAVFWSDAVVQGLPTSDVNIESVIVESIDGNVFEEFSAVLKPAKPLNGVMFKISPAKTLTDDIKVKLTATVGGKPIPEIETTLCKAMTEPVIGQGFVAESNFEPKNCPVNKGSYEILNYIPNTDKMPPLSPGKFEAEVLFSDKTKILTKITVKGEIMNKVPGMG